MRNGSGGNLAGAAAFSAHATTPTWASNTTPSRAMRGQTGVGLSSEQWRESEELMVRNKTLARYSATRTAEAGRARFIGRGNTCGSPGRGTASHRNADATRLTCV